MKRILQNVLIAAITLSSLQIKAQGWVSGSSTSLNPVNSSLGLSPLNIGIGTNSPSAQLHTTGTVRFTGITNSNFLTRIMVLDTLGNVRWRDASTLGGGGANAWMLTGNTAGSGDFLGTLNSQSLRFRTANVERMRIDTLGNVGVNTTAPTARFHTNGTVRLQNLPSGSGSVLVVDSSGNVFVSTSSARAAVSGNDAEIEALKKQVNLLQLAIDNLLANKEISTANTDRLEILQIKPNPVQKNAVFKYHVPSSVTSPVLHIYDTNGNEVKSFRLNEAKGINTFSMQTLALSQGTYLAAITGQGQVSNAIKLVVAQ